ncbi:MAG: 6-phosphofructokinase [Patescibacteria group bacterium]|nr:6-phosphofructokinase [Patescibacteria group bacterium]
MNLKNKKVLVFTGGGLSPSLNPTLYGVIKRAKKLKANIWGGLEGWQCLSNQGKIIPLNSFDERRIKEKGGVFLKSSRTNPYELKNGLENLKNNFKKQKIDYLIAIGGNDTLGTAYKIFKEEKLPIVGVPKTIDNDLSETYWTPGFPTAAFKLINFVKEIRDAAHALSRIFIIEVMGEKVGWLAATSYLGQADIIIPPERYVDIDRVIKIIFRRYKKNNSSAVVVMSKEAFLGDKIKGLLDDQKDGYKVIRHELKAWNLRIEIKKRLGIDTKIIIPGNWLQSGRAIEIDKKLAVGLGQKAVNLLSEKKFGWTPIIKKERGNFFVDVCPLKKILKKRELDESYFDFKNLIPKRKFVNYINSILKYLK